MKKNGATEPFIMLPRSLLASPAWRGASINVYRLLTFLICEHLSHGGKSNGQLKAPKQQLEAAGIGTHQRGAVITEAEARGLITVRRHGMRVATDYGLTWLPTADGEPPTNAWQTFQPNEPPTERANPPVRRRDGNREDVIN